MKLLLTAVTAALVLVSAAGTAPGFTLRPTAQTAKTVTFTWPRQPGADGYLFLRNGVPVARTMNGAATSATFWKGSRYAVSVLHVGAGGHVTTAAYAAFVPPRVARAARPHATKKTRLVFVPAPSPKFSLRVVDRTRKTVTFAWAPQPGADGYQFVRDGAVVARTLKRSVNTATFWKGSRYAVDVLRLASAQDKVVISVRRAVAFRPAKARKARSGLVFRPAPKIDFRLRLVRQTKRTVTFTWKRQPRADGYRFLRNGVAVAQTFNRRTRTATFWKGSRYAVEVLRIAPGKRVTAVMRALAFSTSAKVGTSAERPGSPSGPGATTPASPGSATSPAKDSGATNDSPASEPKPAPAPSPPAAKPASPPAPAPAPAPRPAPAPSPPAVGPGGVVSLSGSYSPNAFFQAVAVAPPGPLTVRGSFSITGDITVSRPNLRIEGASVDGIVGFHAGADGSSLANSHAMGFDIFGADNVAIEGNDLDGRGTVFQNHIWDAGGDTPDGWVIRGNSLSNYYHGDDHSEALFIGYSRNGLVEGNTFTNNGTTAHIFFSWWGDVADPGSSYPRNICVRGNTFNATAGAYFDVNFRAEIPTDADIKIQRNATASTVDYRFYGDC